MKLREHIKAGIGFAIGMTICMTMVAFINQAIDNTLKDMTKEAEKAEPTDKTEEAE